MLFNRITGLVFSLVLLFYGLWILFSRLAMTEVFVNFFIIFTIILLIYSFKEKTFVNYKFFILSAIVFGISFNTKPTSIELVFVLLTIMLFRKSFNKKLNFGVILTKKEIQRTLFLLLIFSAITIFTVFLSNPYFYPDPVNQLFDLIPSSKTFGLLTAPSIENDNFFRFLSTFHTTLIPYFINYYDEPYSETVGGRKPSQYSLTWDTPQTYSTIPLSLFFFIGIYYLANKIRKHQLNFAELLLLIWFSSLFVFTFLTVSWVFIERYFVPLMFPLIFISAYGLSNFVIKIRSKKHQVIFLILFLTSHSVYALSFWERIYFKSYHAWGSVRESTANMVTATIQTTFQDPLVYFPTIALIIILIILYIKNMKIRNKYDVQQK